MSSPLSRLVLLGSLLLAACSSAPEVPGAMPARSEQPPAPSLATRLGELVEDFDGQVGIAIQDVRTGRSVSYDGTRLYPMQSVSKLCVALKTMDAVDRGSLRLIDPVTIYRRDLSVFHQPLRARLGGGSLVVTIGELLTGAIVQSDNAANDILVRLAGGADAVQQAITDRHLAGIRCGPEERFLQSKIAGLTWRPEYSFGTAFWQAREGLDPDLRRARLEAYLADPDDGATPLALATFLTRLARGALLSRSSTEYLLQLMGRATTGPLRLSAGLNPGWSIAHKTGTGQDLRDLSTGYNDVGLVTAPNGDRYAVVVMIASTRRTIPLRQQFMANVTRALVAVHDESHAPLAAR